MPSLDARATLRLARASLGAVHLGIPVDAVVQAIPLPDTPAFLPRRHGALRGVVEHLGALVPVVDLARWVEVGTANPSGQARILVLRDGGRTIGLQVDAVGGLVDVPAHMVTRLHHDDNPDDVFHSAARSPEDGRILSLLEVGRLADLALAWSRTGQDATDADGNAAMASSPASPSAAARIWALLQTGHGRLAVAPGDLTEVIAMPALERFGGGIDGLWCNWRGRHLPVLPAGVLTPGQPAGDGTDRLLAVIEHAGLALGVPVRAALQMCALEGDGLPAPDGVTATLFDADGTELRLLDTARLFARFPEASLSKANDAARQAGKPAPQRAANPVGYIVFDADGLGAAPVGAIEQILPLTAPAGATMDWRGAAITVTDLRGAASGPEGGAAGNVLVVRGAGRHVGFVVARVHSLIPPGTGTLYRMGGPGGQGMAFITTGEGSEQASYRIVDLVGRVDT